MRIGIDATCWANARGYGRFTRELLRAMVAVAPDDAFVFFLDPLAGAGFDLDRSNTRRVEVGLTAAATQAASADGRRSLPDLWRMSRAVAREPLDVFFSPSVYSFFPLPPRLSAVVCIHDVIVERNPELTMPTRSARIFWRLKVWLALRQARLVLTVSDYSAKEITRALGVAPSRIRVAGEAPADAYRPSGSDDEITAAARRVGLPERARWFVYVGGFNPHKHVDAIVRAHGRLVARDRDRAPYLLLVGDAEGDAFHRDVEAIRAAAREQGSEERVVWTGFLPDAELRHLHSGALALVLASEAEGFGLPAVEAAACGAPVIATRASPLPDLLDGGGIFVDPGDVDQLASGLEAVADDESLRRSMGARARERVATLTWEAGARAALDAIYEAAA